MDHHCVLLLGMFKSDLHIACLKWGIILIAILNNDIVWKEEYMQ